MRVRANMKEKLTIAADTLPLMLIAGLTGFSVVAVALLLFDQFSAVAVWTLGVLAALACAAVVWRAPRFDRPGSRRERLVCDVIVLVLLVLWGVWNIRLTSEHILTNRDPATYAIASAWLSQHDSLRMDAPTSLKGVENVYPAGAGFTVDHTSESIHAQAQHVLPALLGTIGKVVGPKHVLHFNVLFGMTALLAVYCFGRLFMRSPWALLAASVMAFSLPLLYFTRDTYTEPLALTFTFGGLALLWAAQKTRRLGMWLLAGATVGAGVLTRIDGYLTVIGVAAFLTAYTVFAATSREQKQRVKEALVFAGAAAVVCVLAWFDLMLLSTHYFEDTLRLVSLEVAMVAAIVVVAAVLNIVRAKNNRLVSWLQIRTVRWRPAAAALLVLVLGVLLMSRPAWMVQYGENTNPFVSGLQEYEHDKVETRGYAEMSTDWASWYIGPVLSGLGVIGLAYAAYRSAREKEMLLLGAVLVILGTSLVYFMKPNITPDQIWASRRMLPVIMPGLALFGAYGLAQLASRVRFPSVWFKRSVIGVAAAGLVVVPLTVSGFFLGARDTTQYALMPGLCGTLPKNAVVLWLGTGRTQAVQPTATYCGVDAYGFGMLHELDKPNEADLAKVAKIARKNGKEPFVGVYKSQIDKVIEPSQAKKMTKVSSASSSNVEQTLTAPPRRMEESRMSMSLAIIKDDGELQKIK